MSVSECFIEGWRELWPRLSSIYFLFLQFNLQKFAFYYLVESLTALLLPKIFCVSNDRLLRYSGLMQFYKRVDTFRVLVHILTGTFEKIIWNVSNLIFDAGVSVPISTAKQR
jgi:hypothetical protein